MDEIIRGPDQSDSWLHRSGSGLGGRRGCPVGESIIANWTDDVRFKQYVALWNRRKFFEAHEALEDLWLCVEGEEKEILQALIQLAVALEHDARGNAKGSAKVLASARARLARLPGGTHDLLASALADQVEDHLAGRTNEPPPFPDFTPGMRGSNDR